jgi:hypothetical protein
MSPWFLCNFLFAVEEYKFQSNTMSVQLARVGTFQTRSGGDMAAPYQFAQICASHITCQHINAKHRVKDGFAFLWEHAIFVHPPNKNPLTDRSDNLHI